MGYVFLGMAFAGETTAFDNYKRASEVAESKGDIKINGINIPNRMVVDGYVEKGDANASLAFTSIVIAGILGLVSKEPKR